MASRSHPDNTSFIQHLIETNYAQLIFCFFSGLCCFLPLLIGVTSYLEEKPLRAAISSSKTFHNSCVAITAIVVPLVIDLLCDLANTIISSCGINSVSLHSGMKNKARFNLLNMSERVLILMGIVMLPLVSFLPTTTYNLGMIYVCCNRCQLNWVGGTVALSLSRYNKEYWTTKSTLTSLFFLSLGLISAPFIQNALAYDSKSRSTNYYYLFAVLSTSVSCFIFFFCSSRWMIVVYCKSSQWRNFLFCKQESKDSENSCPTGSGDVSYHTFFPMVYTICGFCVVAFLCIITASTTNMGQYDGRIIFLTNIPFLILAVLISILSMRIVKFEVVQGLYALIESKKSYVRYISHELRTPLNSVFLGLKLLTDDNKGVNTSESEDRGDILADVSVACRTAVDILNDLLCFDKMESGILEVHKLDVPVMSFLADSVGMFSVQAREGNVAISILTGASEALDLKHLTHLPLLEDDIVFIDRFKMDQVIRNLVSNALKFTPRGGTVTVAASFVPNRRGVLPSLPEETPPPPRPSNSYKVGRLLPTFRRPSGEKIHVECDLEGGLSRCPSQFEDPAYVKGKLVIVVTDSGAGMKEEEICRLFKEIVQFKPEVLQAGGGSGLGLWITKGIMDLHGGTVEAFSDGLGLGSSFIVELSMQRKSSAVAFPLFNVAVAAPVKEKEEVIVMSPNISALWKPGPSTKYDQPMSVDEPFLNLLIVDDSALNRKMLLRMFRSAGHHCDEAMDGLQAVERVRDIMSSPSKSYNAVLMDFVMPNMDGPSATKKIRSLGYAAPIFGVTGNTLESDVNYFLGMGADKVFAKPLNIDHFELAMVEIRD